LLTDHARFLENVGSCHWTTRAHIHHKDLATPIFTTRRYASVVLQIKNNTRGTFGDEKIFYTDDGNKTHQRSRAEAAERRRSL